MRAKRFQQQAPDRSGRPSRLPTALAVVFAIALVAGPGPGSAWISGAPTNPNFVVGVPALYAWTVLWFLVMAACIVLAARGVWRDAD